MRSTSALIFALAAFGLAACGGEPRPAEPSARVDIKTFMFQPDPLEIRRGTEVTWVNADSTVHTVTSGTRESLDGRFDSRVAERGGRSSHRFERPGRYRYVCTVHSGPGMEAEVIVR